MRPRIIAALLWAALAFGVALIVLMTWHPWVIGNPAGCPPGAARAWNGHCEPIHP